MNGISEIIFIVVLIVIFLTKASSKAKKEAEERKRMNIPQTPDKEVEEYMELEDETPSPFLTFDYTPPAPPKKTPPKQKAQPKRKTIPAPPPIQETQDTDQQFDIHSTEEVRRAIIWSEILNKKY